MAIEPPSTTLVQLLLSLNLATARDLRACQQHIRHLVRDLPAFDSVWIDALVQGELLTPFQAKCLAQRPDSLKLGSYLLIDRLPHDGWPVRYRAKPLAGGRSVAIAVLPVAESERDRARQRFERHLTAVQKVTHRNLCLATTGEDDAESVIATSPLPSGEPLDELLVRRGRYPADVVEEIARQALEGLSRLEQAQTFHGDVRLRNVLLGPAGRIQIINAGLLAAVHPLVTIHELLPIACLEGIAPELFGGRTARNSASDMYALGCLLWQLLAGRRPYLTADRLEQLAAHQAGTIPDIRSLAPETPPALAQLIIRLVAKHPTERFASLAAASREWGGSLARGRARLSQFQASFQSMVPVRLGRSARTLKPAAVQSIMTAAILIGAVGLFLFPGAGRSMLDSAGRLLSAKQTPEEPKDIGSLKPQPSPPLKVTATAPSPQETTKHSGRIILDKVGPYAASSHSAVGELRITGKEGVRPVIEVGDQPLQLAAQRVVLENVIIRRTANGAPDVPLLSVDSQILIATGCEFHSGPLQTTSDEDAAMDAKRVAIRWRRLDDNDIQPGEIELAGCLCLGGGAVLDCDSVPQLIQIQDTACLGTGPVCNILSKPSLRTLRMSLTRTTLRETGPLLRESQLTLQKQTPIVIDLRQSVLALRPEVAVVEAIGPLLSRWRPDVKIESNGAYLAGDTLYVATRTEPESEPNPLDPTDLDIEGLLPAEIEFAGPLAPRWHNNLVTRYTADVQSTETPGIKPSPSPPPLPSPSETP
jgi:eukaryotic-like serine/threonine-protein kinase